MGRDALATDGGGSTLRSGVGRASRARRAAQDPAAHARYVLYRAARAHLPAAPAAFGAAPSLAGAILFRLQSVWGRPLARREQQLPWSARPSASFPVTPSGRDWAAEDVKVDGLLGQTRQSGPGSGPGGACLGADITRANSDGLETESAAAAAVVEEMSVNKSQEMDGDTGGGGRPKPPTGGESHAGAAHRSFRRDVMVTASWSRLWPPPAQLSPGVCAVGHDGVVAPEEEVVRAVHSVYMAATLRAGGALERQARRAHDALEESSASSVAFTRSRFSGVRHRRCTTPIASVESESV